QFVQNDTVVNKTFVWKQRQVLDCTGYVPGNYHEGYKVTWLLDGRQACSKSTCQNDHFNINLSNFSLSFDYYPTFTTYECQIDSNVDGQSLTTVTVASYRLSTSNNDS
uniref:Ig-like domain-containing protein n=1 Tax=Amphimedon queenslandica TaxID=400682 RepID=A0A1X7SMV7_AMPQE